MGRDGEMAAQVKKIAAKPENLSSIPCLTWLLTSTHAPWYLRAHMHSLEACIRISEWTDAGSIYKVTRALPGTSTYVSCLSLALIWQYSNHYQPFNWQESRFVWATKIFRYQEHFRRLQRLGSPRIACCSLCQIVALGLSFIIINKRVSILKRKMEIRKQPYSLNSIIVAYGKFLLSLFYLVWLSSSVDCHRTYIREELSELLAQNF